MPVTNSNATFRLGFLATVELPGRGHVGGLLVTNHLGRPLEFQCTAPVKANRTQEILYGHTLAAYLLCDVIGRTLLEKVGVKPQLVLVDDPRLLDVREQVELPVASVGGGVRGGSDERQDSSGELSGSRTDEPASEQAARVDRPVRLSVRSEPSAESARRLGRQRVVWHPSFAADAGVLDEARRRLPADADLCEPFQRVREALRETMGAAA